MMESTCTGKIAGFGIPLLDFIAEVDTEFLTKYDLESNGSNQASADQRKVYEELASMDGVKIIPGGAVPNTLRVAQWLLGVAGRTVSIGCIGDDDFGRHLTFKLQSEGVCAQYEVHDSKPTGTCAVLVTGHNRCLLANFGAARHLSADFLKQPDSQRQIQSASHLYLAAYFVHTYPSFSKQVAERASREDKVLILNLSAVYVCQESTNHILDVIEHAQFIFGNESELKALAGALHFKETDCMDIMMRLSTHTSDQESRCHVIITNGPDPTWWCDGTTVRKFNVPSIDEDKIVDTCGAGDAFVGGFLSQLIQTKPIEECIRCGHYAAGLSIQQRGMTIAGSPDFR